MIDQSLAQPRIPDTRGLRGLALFEEHHAEIRFERSVWLVPSQNDRTSVYEVRLGKRESCECRDHAARGMACKHTLCATIARAKTKACDGCGGRTPNRETVEVGPELAGWGGASEGERYCRPCARRRGVL